MYKKKGIDVTIYSPINQVKHKLYRYNLQIVRYKNVKPKNYSNL